MGVPALLLCHVGPISRMDCPAFSARSTGSAAALDAAPRARCTAPTAAAAAARAGRLAEVRASAMTRSLSAWLSVSPMQLDRRPAQEAAAARTVALFADRPACLWNKNKI